jgi:hypothetical protein
MAGSETDDSGTVRYCKLGGLLATMPEDESAALQAALDNERVSSADIYRVVKAAGYRVGKTLLKEHRRGDCCCGEDAE